MSTSSISTENFSERDNFVTRLAESIGSRAKVATVFGEPIEREGVTVVPVATARWGMGGGGGQGASQHHYSQHGYGGGGGMVVKPVGYLVMRGGDVEYREIGGALRALTAMLAGAVLGAVVLRGWRSRA
jgi:uncharacterized spore protein YtfJ